VDAAPVDQGELEAALRPLVAQRLTYYAAAAVVWSGVTPLLLDVTYPGIAAAAYVVTGLYFCASLGALAFARRLGPRVSASATTGIGVALGLAQLGFNLELAERSGDATQLYIGAASITAAGVLLLHTRWVAIYALLGSAWRCP
jgi:hypothetical protein